MNKVPGAAADYLLVCLWRKNVISCANISSFCPYFLPKLTDTAKSYTRNLLYCKGLRLTEFIINS
jgi:hypothetical protein